MNRILLIVVGLILYGSFYPWQFHSVDLPASPFWILLHSWPRAFARADARDAAINLALYMPFGAFCFLTLPRQWSSAARFAITLSAAIGLSASIEMTQLFARLRNCSLFDVLCNGLGAGFGIALGAAFPGRIAAAVRGAEELGAFRRSGSIALLYLWAGYHLFPLMPSLNPWTLRTKLAVFARSDIWVVRDLVEGFSAWIAVAALLALVVRRHPWRALAVALLAIPCKLLISKRTATPAEVIGTLLGILGWMLCRSLQRSRLVAGLVSLAALIASGLLPFHISSNPQAFTWTPFLALLSASWEASFVVLLRKSFLYGSVIWLLTENGRGWTRSTLLVAVPLAILEGVQIYLPGRTPEITDPLLALLLGVILMLLERESRAAALPDHAPAHGALAHGPACLPPQIESKR